MKSIALHFSYIYDQSIRKIRDVYNLIVEDTLILTIVNFLFSDQGFLV